MDKKLIDEIRKESYFFESSDPECSNEQYAEQILRDLENPPTIEIIKN